MGVCLVCSRIEENKIKNFINDTSIDVTCLDDVFFLDLFSFSFENKQRLLIFILSHFNSAVLHHIFFITMLGSSFVSSQKHTFFCRHSSFMLFCILLFDCTIKYLSFNVWLFLVFCLFLLIFKQNIL